MKATQYLSDIARLFQSDLERRFVKYTVPGVDGHNAIMLAATALDLRYRLLLNPVQSDSAKGFLGTLVSTCCGL